MTVPAEKLFLDGLAAYQAGEFEVACSLFRDCHRLAPQRPSVNSNLLGLLIQLYRFEEALVLDRAFDGPRGEEYLLNLSRLYRALGKVDRAIEILLSILRDVPQHPPSLYELASLHELSGRCAEASALYEMFLTLSPTDPKFAHGKALHQRMLICDWRDFDQATALISSRLKDGERVIEPFAFQAICDREDQLFQCAKVYSNSLGSAIHSKPPLPHAEPHVCISADRSIRPIRIGFVCGEFYEQATSYLMLGVWKEIDREKFEVQGFDTCPYPPESQFRDELIKLFTKFHLVGRCSDEEAARIIDTEEIDLLVNLNGFFGFSRPGIFRCQAAAKSINFLGFPGTLCDPAIEYLIADSIVIPESSEKFYSETILRLPVCYQPNIGAITINSLNSGSRADHGLPPSGFVFCCFNNNYKFTPKMLDVWCDILHLALDSVLWLLDGNKGVRENLAREFGSRGICCSRLVFASRLSNSEHLARHAHADLFLDSIPYNAHTTASDALRTGLPVLTVTGKTFPGRVTTSILTHLGLQEHLVTSSLSEYVERALELYSNRVFLNKIRSSLEEAKLSSDYFNAKRFTREFERVLMDIPLGKKTG